MGLHDVRPGGEVGLEGGPVCRGVRPHPDLAHHVHAPADPFGIDQSHGSLQNSRLFQRPDPAPARRRRRSGELRQGHMAQAGVAL